jgi:hypothetical protein
MNDVIFALGMFGDAVSAVLSFVMELVAAVAEVIWCLLKWPVLLLLYAGIAVGSLWLMLRILHWAWVTPLPSL